MLLTFHERPSDSPFVERIWRSESHAAGEFVSVAASHVEIAVTRQRGRVFLTIRGPETRATPAECPAVGDWIGIRFKLGTFMPGFAPGDLKDRHDVTLPGATGRSFWLNGSAWDYPDFDNADAFVARLARKGLIFDQAHLTRSLKTLIGQTPLQIRQGNQQLSFLYKTPPPAGIYDADGRFAHDCIGTNHQPR